MSTDLIDGAKTAQNENIEDVGLKPIKELAYDPRLEIGGSHHKNHAERRLALKLDLLVLPLAALVLLIAYMVSASWFLLDAPPRAQPVNDSSTHS